MTAAIEIDRLSFTYPEGTKALDSISLTVEEGETIAILGANGAGKSTLLLHLNGLLGGGNSVKVLGMPVDRHNLKKIRQSVGIVFQNPDDQLFCPTVRDDVAFGPRNMGLSEEDVEIRVAQSIMAVGLDGSAGRAPFHLSLGEKKRAAIATVLAMRPSILAIDEPTSSLDPKGSREIMELLARIGGTQLHVTHDLEHAGKTCKRAIVLHRGTIVADGPVGEILNSKTVLVEAGLL